MEISLHPVFFLIKKGKNNNKNTKVNDMVLTTENQNIFFAVIIDTHFTLVKSYYQFRIP